MIFGTIPKKNALLFAYMQNFFLLLLGVLCLVIYKFASPENWLLVASMVLELGGIFTYIFVNKKA